MYKIKNALEDEILDPSRVYSWVSSDPESRHQTQGLIMRQGLTPPLITKGLRRTRRLFEADILKIAIAEGVSNVEMGSKVPKKLTITRSSSACQTQCNTIQSKSRESTLTSDTFTCCVSLCSSVHLLC